MTSSERLKLNRKLMQAARYAAMTPAQRLEAGANQMLAATGFFAPKEHSDNEYIPVDADSIGLSGNLRPTWQGRA